MQTVAIATNYDMVNYGTMLQSYAMQRALNEMGYATLVIDQSGISRDIRQKRLRYAVENCLNVNYVIAKLGRIRRIIMRKVSRSFRAEDDCRRKAFSGFAEGHFNFSEPFGTIAELTSACRGFDAVLVGSDQLWLPINIAGDFYTLSFAPAETRKIAYATSFGVSALPPKYEKLARIFINRIDALSVREKSGVEIIQKLTGRNAALVCDPTLLLTVEEWMQMEAPQPLVQSPYVLCYLLGDNPSHRDYAKRLAEQTGCDMVMFKHLDDYIVGDEKLHTLSSYDVGPCEFLNYIHYAQYIVTDSFHGVMFSLIYHKRFVHFNRHRSNARYSTNSRIQSILGVAGIPTQSMADAKSAPTIPPDVDYELVQPRLDAFRAASLDFLNYAVKGSSAKDESAS